MVDKTRMNIFLIITIASFFVTCRSSSNDQDGRIDLHIGGIFPMSASISGWAGGQACLPAALMALDDINSRGDVIPGYKLVLHGYRNDSRMGYGSSSPALSDKGRFPTLFRTHPSAIIHNPARLAMFEKYNWKRIGVIHSNDEVFSTTADDLEEKLSQAGAQIVARQNFGDPADAVMNLKRQDARIIVGMFYEQAARQVLCEVYKKNLYGPRYVWFLIGWYKDEWYLPQAGEFLDCSAEEMKKAAQFHFTTEGLMRSKDTSPGISNMKFDDFQKRLMANLSKDFNTTSGTQEAPLAYDAIWAVALAFNCTIQKLQETGSLIRLEHFIYTDVGIRQTLDSCMKQVDFAGVSGEVKFSLSGDRITLTQIEQLQGDSYVVVGNYDEQRKIIEWSKDAIVIFPGGKPPQDETYIKEEWKSVSVDVYGSMTFFAGVGIAVAIACIGFNYGFCYRKLIYLSQYQVNNLMVAGCVVCFVAIFITGLPMETSPNHRDTFSALCHARVTLLMYGFTLVYGALFSKVWIVHRMGSVDSRDQAVAAWKFYAVVGVFAAIDTVIALVWVVVDPLQRSEEDIHDTPVAQNESSVEDIKIDSKLEHCSSKYLQVWIGVIYTYKGLLLLFGLFLAYEIRNAKAKHVNDSRFVSMAIYNVAVLCLITAPVTLIIPSQPDANFGFIACTILLCTFISMGLIFVPKVLHVVRVPSAAEQHKQSGGTGGSASLTESTLTKEEQDRLKKLLQENEDIQRQIAEKDQRILELRRRLQFRIAQHQQNLAANSESSQHKASISSHQLPNGQGNKNLTLPTTSITTDVVTVATKRSSSVAPLPQTTTAITCVRAQTAIGTETGAPSGTRANVPTEPQPPHGSRDVDDSGYRSSTNGRNIGCVIEPADTDVLL